MKLSERFLLGTVIVAVGLAAAAQAMVPHLYHGTQSPQATFAGGIGFAVLIGTAALALAAWDRSRRLLKAFVMVFFFYNIHLLIREWELTTALATRAAALVVMAALLWYLTFRVGAEGWQTLSKAIIVASAIFAGSPFLLSWANPSSPVQIGAPDFVRVPGIHNYLIIILDETSPEYATGFTRDLVHAQLYVKSAEVGEAGMNTLNAIPSMFSNARHDDVAPCTWTALCGAQSFKFSALSADSDKTDIVGFHHPYCAIQGLRSCFRQESAFNESSPLHVGFYNLWCAQFNWGGVFSACKEALPSVAVLDRSRKNMQQKVDQAPFWREGGVLFVHFPLPHPSLAGALPLKAEYESNIVQAERLVAALTARMMSTFGKDFVLLITSDHPLRTWMWCTSEYRARGCSASMPVDRGRVPLIVASPQPMNGTMPTSNVGLFAAADAP